MSNPSHHLSTLIIETYSIPANKLITEIFKLNPSTSLIKLNYKKFNDLLLNDYNKNTYYYINYTVNSIELNMLKYYFNQIVEIVTTNNNKHLVRLINKQKRSISYFSLIDNKYQPFNNNINNISSNNDKRYNGINNINSKDDTLPYLSARDDEIYTFPNTISTSNSDEDMMYGYDEDEEDED
ncbi:hypothetical protein CDIK_1333 [Cucumispora dikerogammari]|nr:hypothetical protein CDIK_1333 [Cucumispora dikerogammari]